jgi:PKD repeat protein
MSRLLRFLIYLGIFLGLGISCASAADANVFFNPQTVDLLPGSSQNVQLVMDKVPAVGLSGFNITITVLNPEIAEITNVSAPSWNGMIISGSISTSTVPASSVWIKSLNNGGVKIGDTNISLGSITLTGKKMGTTDVNIIIKQMDDDTEFANPIYPNVTTCNVHVLGILPIAEFTKNATEGTIPFAVKFDASASQNADSYSWNFGDGINGTGKIVDHTFEKAGTFNVKLTVSNANGTANSTVQTVTAIEPIMPVANFTANKTSGLTPLTVNFVATTSTPDATYSWDFGDGTNGTGQVVEHIFIVEGQHEVVLTVTNANGTANSIAQTITAIEPILPIAEFSKNATEGTIPFAVKFDASTSQNADSYSWNFGDGSNGTGKIVEHTFENAGTFNITLKVSNANGTANSTAQTITVIKSILPIAEFTKNATEGITPFAVNFVATTSTSDATYSWDFGDGGNGTGQVVDHTFIVEGQHEVVLTVTNANGTANSTQTITAIEPILPIAEFTKNATEGITPFTVNFDASASQNADSYSWNFGDGTNGTGKIVEHTFEIAGIFNVVLKVSNANGTANSTAQTITAIEPIMPVANFTADKTSGVTPLIVNFDASASQNADSYSWSFGDGTNGTGKIVEHTFENAGTFNVILKVSNANGTANSTAQTITAIEPIMPVASFTANKTLGLTPLTVTFDASASQNADSYSWDFGDGTNGTGKIVEHTFEKAGTLDIVLKVSNANGTANSTQTITAIEPILPIAEFTKNATEGTVPFAVKFNASTSQNVDSYSWDFGDGTNGTGKIVEHTFEKAGTFDVVLTVRNANGTANSTAQTVTAVEPILPIAEFTKNTTEGLTPLTVNFIATASTPDATYSWDFGDEGNGTGQIVDHTFANAGNFNVILTVSNANGTANSTQTITAVEPIMPVANFTANKTSGLTPLTVTFDASTSQNADSYSWNFGDGTNGTGKIVEHTFAKAGTFNVILTVRNANSTNSTVQTVTAIEPILPIAEFTKNATEGITPFTVNFVATTSTSDATYSWDFGDGINGTGKIVEHTFAKAGTFDVVLKVSNANGTVNSTAQTITAIEPVLPVASFIANKTLGLTPLTVTFDASTSQNADSYYWDFGDGTNGTGKIVDHTFENTGIFNVVLKVSNANGTVTSTPQTITAVEPILPVAEFTKNATEGLIPFTVNFDASTSQNADSYSWNFGDGSNGTGKIVEHTFAKAGTYNVILTVSNANSTNSTEQNITAIEPILPIAEFTKNATEGLIPFTVNFDASTSQNADSYSWNFGDGSNGTGKIVEHTFAKAGTFNVILTVSNANGTNSTPQTIITEVPPPVPPSFTANKTSGVIPLTVNFNASASQNADSYYWDFGDGNYGTGQVVDHTFANAGNFNVILTVSNANGIANSTQTITAVEPILPVAEFTKNATEGVKPLTVAFNASTSQNADSYAWDFGDGTNGTGQVVEHTFENAGTFNVVLTVSNANSTNSTAQTITVEQILHDTIPPVIGSVTLFPTSTTTGSIINVTVNATDNSGVRNVTANDISLLNQGGSIWAGSIIAVEGIHSVNVYAEDEDGNIAWNNSTAYTALNSTNCSTWINWTWHNPIDSNFNHTEIYLNGIFQNNTIAEYFNATSLQPDTSYTLSTRTVDFYGNVNETWVNSTATTSKEMPDVEKPVIQSVVLFPANTTAGSKINITVNATDNVGVAEVKADNISLIKENDGLWRGNITAPSTRGDYSLLVKANDISGNAAVTSAPYHVVQLSGSASIAASPKISSVTAGSNVSPAIIVKNSQNTDDTFKVWVSVSELPASSQANLTWFGWTEKSIKLRAGEEITLPVKVDVPAGTAAGRKLFRINVKSETTGISGFNTGYLTIT